jgi:hypothetical protein
MSDISLWEAMRKVESFNPRWKFRRNYRFFQIYFETNTSDGLIRVEIQEGYWGREHIPHTYDGYRLSITQDGVKVFSCCYNVVYKSGFFGGPEKPHYSKEYIYLKNYIQPYLEMERQEHEEDERQKREKKRAEELKNQERRNKFFGR